MWIARKVPHETAARVRSLGLIGIDLKEEETGLRVDTAGRLASTRARLRRHRRKRSRRRRVRVRRRASRSIRAASRSKPTSSGGRFRSDANASSRPRNRASDVELTIDPYLQFVAERALAKQVSAFHALDGTAIVMDPWTGEILALANMPDFDPNRFWKYSDAQRRDRAVMDAYEPGSTYKLLTAAAALESHKVTLDEPLSGARPARNRRSDDSQRGRRLHGRNGRQRDARADRGVLA